ncbi:hypothetical protein GOP47_0025145 [Adiantum capillus-veneris]|uniref:Glutaredoxin domain-containing protein n=1 Tax=Adiantum capillus-veneris TaxID=13818 RepID=A0A9D4U3K9_ADICA|nr:hypothetical protein GOP47_0025145 [Adiantum capillus-veneris]
MGCASSKAVRNEIIAEKGFSKGISMPSTLPQQLPDDFHIVALTSSTYGILKVDTPKPPEEDTKDGNMGAHSVKEVLNKLNNLESKEEAAPQSWLEVSSMLENLKPDLDKPPNNPKSGKGANKPQQPDAIDIHDIMLDLDEDTGLVRPKARKLANLKKSGKSLPIHTLEELDKRAGGKMNDLKHAASQPVSIADVRASLKPVGTAKPSTTAHEKTTTAPLQQYKEHKLNSATAELAHDGGIKRDSELIDDSFLQSYKSAFNTLSEDEWKVMEALCQDSDTDLHRNSGEESCVVELLVDMEQTDEHVAESGSFESEVISFPVEDDESTSSSAEGSLTSTSLGTTESMSGKGGVDEKSPLEDYEELCPPGGKQAVVLYTTSMRGIRKTYEDCLKAREIMKSYGVMVDERDVSMHLEYRNELRELMQRVVTVPRLFVKGRYIGGGEVIAKLAEDGQLALILEGATRTRCGTEGAACDGCAGAKFVPCLECSGSCKVVNDRKQVVRCSECNENGLIQCPICS